MVANAGKAGEGRDAASVARELAAALALWRGPPLADLTYEPFAQNEIRRLEQLRLAALENRVDAELRWAWGRSSFLSLSSSRPRTRSGSG